MADANLQLVITAKDEASAKLRGVSSSVSGLSKAGSLLASGLKVAAVAITAVAGATVAFGVSSVKAFELAEASQKRFETGLKNISKASDEEIAMLRRQQMALQGVTRFEDDAIASGQAFLATFQLNAKQIQKLTPNLLDMAEGLRDATGATIGLEQASQMVGKAMQLGTLTMLQRVGVTVPGTTKAMQDLFKAKFQNATMDERVIMMGTLLQGNFKGQAEAAGKTLAGALTIMNNQWGNFKENVGAYLAGEGNGILQWGVQFTAMLQSIDINGIAQQGITVWTQFTATIRGFFQETNWIWVFIRDFFVPLWEQLRAAFVDAWTQIYAALLPIMPELKIFAEYLGVIIVGVLMILIKAFVETIVIISKALTGFVNIFSGAIQFLEGVFTFFCDLIFGNWSALIDDLKKIWNGLYLFIKGIAQVIFSPFGSAIEKWKAEFRKAIDTVIGWWNDLKEKLSHPLKAMINIFKSDKDSDKKALGGAVTAGQSYIVGENRPEVFVPSQSGNIRQTSQVGKEVNINFNNVSVRNDNDLDTIVRAVRKAINKEQEYYNLGAL